MVAWTLLAAAPAFGWFPGPPANIYVNDTWVAVRTVRSCRPRTSRERRVVVAQCPRNCGCRITTPDERCKTRHVTPPKYRGSKITGVGGAGEWLGTSWNNSREVNVSIVGVRDAGAIQCLCPLFQKSPCWITVADDDWQRAIVVERPITNGGHDPMIIPAPLLLEIAGFLRLLADGIPVPNQREQARELFDKIGEALPKASGE
jgi:hypothetical protein